MIAIYADTQMTTIQKVVGQHGHDDCKENDRHEDRDKSVSVEGFDDAGY